MLKETTNLSVLRRMQQKNKNEKCPNKNWVAKKEKRRRRGNKNKTKEN